jgi:hypothetical protein
VDSCKIDWSAIEALLPKHDEAAARRVTIGCTLSHYQGFIRTFDESFRQRSDAMVAEFDTFAQTLPEQEHEDAAYAFDQAMKDVEVHFPSTAWLWIFVGIHAFLEKELASICLWFKSKGKHTEDPRDSGIGDSKDYLKKVCCIAFPSNSQEWREIKDYQHVRRAIVHNHGALPSESKRRASVLQFAARHPSLKIEDGQIIVAKEFCEEFLATVERFFDQVVALMV